MGVFDEPGSERSTVTAGSAGNRTFYSAVHTTPDEERPLKSGAFERIEKKQNTSMVTEIAITKISETVFCFFMSKLSVGHNTQPFPDDEHRRFYGVILF